MATIGKTNIGATNDSTPGNFILAVGPFTPSSSGTLTTISLYHRSGSTAGLGITAGIYTSKAGPEPDALVATSTAGTSVSGPAWVDLTITGSITAGVDYWIAFRSALGTINLFNDDDAGAPKTRYASSTYSSGSLPATYPANTPQEGVISLYATYTETNTFIPRVIGII